MASSSRDMRLHKLLYQHIAESMTEADGKQFNNITEGTYLPSGVVSRCNGDMYKLLNTLETNGVISLGNYNKLMHILLDSKLLKIYREVMIKSDEINEILKLNPSTPTNQCPKPIATASDVKQETVKETRIYQNYKLEQLKEKSDSWLNVCKSKEVDFFPTSVYVQALGTIRDNSSLLLVGNPGEGKSSILQELALELSEDGFLILFVKDLKEIEDQFLQNRKILFIFDDPFGEEYCIMTKAEKWVHRGELFFQMLYKSTQIKLLFACNLSVWSECAHLLDKLSVFRNKCSICSSKLSLEEKEGIVKRHLPATINVSDETLHVVCSVNTVSFPRSCKLLSKAGIQFKDDSEFVSHFMNPVEQLLHSLPHTENGHLSYVMLVSVMLNGGYLPCDIKRLNGRQRAMIKCIAASNDDQILQLVFNSTENMAGEFLCQTLSGSEKFYKFKEENFLEMVLNDFARKDPSQFSEWCELNLITDIITRKGSGSSGTRTLGIPRDVCALFVKILITNIIENNYWCISVFTDSIQSEVINFLSTNDNIVSRLIENDSEDNGNFLYHLIKTRTDRVSVFLCQRQAKSSRFSRFHPIVALSNGGRHVELTMLLDLLSNGGLQSYNDTENLLNNNTTRRSRCKVTQTDNSYDSALTDNNFCQNYRNFHGELLDCIAELCGSNLPAVLGHALLQAVAQKQTNVVETLLKYTTVMAKFDLSLAEAFCSANNDGHTNNVKDVLLLNLSQLTRDETLIEVVRRREIELTRLLLETDSSPTGIYLALLEVSKCNQENILDLLQQYNPTIEGIRAAIPEGIGDLCRSVSDNDGNDLSEQSFSVFGEINSGAFDQISSQHETTNTLPHQIKRDLKRAVVMRDTEMIEKMAKNALPIRETNQCIDGLARTGDTELLDLLLQDTAPNECFQTAFISASWGGHLDALKSVTTNRVSDETLSKAVIEASRRNQLSVVDYLTDLTSDPGTVEEALFAAVWMGHLSVLSFIVDKLESILSTKLMKRLLIVSAKQRHHEIAKFLLPLCKDPYVISMVLRISAESGHDDFVRECLPLVPDECSLGDLLEVASWYGQISLLEQLQERQIPPNNIVNAIYNASMRGQLIALGVLLKYETTEDTFPDSFPSVVRTGDQDSVNIMLSKDLPEDVLGRGLNSATITNNSEIIHRILPHIQSPQTKRAAVLSAAFRGDTDLLKPLSIGVSEDILEEAFLRAAWAGKLSTVKYLANSLPQTALTKAINAATVRHHTHIVCFLLEKSNLVPLKTPATDVYF